MSIYVLEHQEKWNGTGYPRKLKGNNISIQARMIALADAYDAMTSKRPYRETMTKEQALAEIRKFSGTQFDPTLAETFIQMILRKEL
jgi:HD-GYP domain-containing protein (c-di-GMP phosphodiesterase class II)